MEEVFLLAGGNIPCVVCGNPSTIVCPGCELMPYCCEACRLADKDTHMGECTHLKEEWIDLMGEYVGTDASEERKKKRRERRQEGIAEKKAKDILANRKEWIKNHDRGIQWTARRKRPHTQAINEMPKKRRKAVGSVALRTASKNQSILALAEATHPRLGRKSAARGLPGDVLRWIMEMMPVDVFMATVTRTDTNAIVILMVNCMENRIERRIVLDDGTTRALGEPVVVFPSSGCVSLWDKPKGMAFVYRITDQIPVLITQYEHVITIGVVGDGILIGVLDGGTVVTLDTTTWTSDTTLKIQRDVDRFGSFPQGITRISMEKSVSHGLDEYEDSVVTTLPVKSVELLEDYTKNVKSRGLPSRRMVSTHIGDKLFLSGTGDGAFASMIAAVDISTKKLMWQEEAPWYQQGKVHVPPGSTQYFGKCGIFCLVTVPGADHRTCFDAFPFDTKQPNAPFEITSARFPGNDVKLLHDSIHWLVFACGEDDTPKHKTSIVALRRGSNGDVEFYHVDPIADTISNFALLDPTTGIAIVSSGLGYVQTYATVINITAMSSVGTLNYALLRENEKTTTTTTTTATTTTTTSKILIPLGRSAYIYDLGLRIGYRNYDGDVVSINRGVTQCCSVGLWI